MLHIGLAKKIRLGFLRRKNPKLLANPISSNAETISTVNSKICVGSQETN